ncbi:MAG: methyltransferase domain-containing protein, partial [Actinomycetota bacterium]
AVLDRLGIEPGWHCLEVGAGAGTVSRWLGEQVGEDGRVMSTDVDLRFHTEDVGDNVIVREHDITTDRLPNAHFDLIHARAVLQHLPEREEVFAAFLKLAKPGAWIVVEDGDFRSFAAQPLPEPFGSIHRLIAEGAADGFREPDFGSRAIELFRRHEMTDVDVLGDTWAMRGNEDSGEWWFMAIEHVAPRLVEAGLFTQDQIDAALAQVRNPGFVMLSTQSLAVWGRTPRQ